MPHTAENEGNVRYALNRWGGSPDQGGCLLTLVPAEPRLGGPGLVEGTSWLSAIEAGMVQRFDPSNHAGDDTMGFFIAKFKKGGRQGI